METIMANGQLGISSFDKTSSLYSRYSINPSLLQGFTKISSNPIIRITINRGKVKKNRIFSVKSSELVEIEKQFEFQPAFDDYLKAMESVKTVRKKKPVEGDEESEVSGDAVEGYSEKPGLWRSKRELGFSERENGVVKKMSGLELGEGLLWKDIEGRKETGLGGRRDGVSKLGRKGVDESSRGLGHRKLEYKENKIDLSNGVGFGEVEVEGERNSEKPGLWIRQKGGSNRQLGLGERGNEAAKKMGGLEFGEQLSRKGSVGRSERCFEDGVSHLDRKGSVESTRGSYHPKLEYKENEMDVSNEMGFEEAEVDESVNKISRRWTNGVTSKLDVKENASRVQRLNGVYRSSNIVKRVESDEDMHGEGLDDKRNYTDMQKKPLNTNVRPVTNMQKKPLSSNARQATTRDRNAERPTDFNGTSKWVTERQQPQRSSVDSKTSESALNLTLSEWEGISRNSREIEDGETGSWKNTNTKDLSRRSKVDKHIYDSDVSIRNKREISYRDQGNMSKTEKLYSRSTKTHMELNRDHTLTDDNRSKVSIKRGNFSRTGKFLKEDVDENDMEMERAAFKSFEVFTDLRGQPRVLRMEMEERIKSLAKWLNGTDIDLPEWLFSKMIHSARIRFSDHSILRVIQILGTYGNWRRVLQVIEWLQSRERFKSYKSRFIYTAALDVLGKAKRPSEALNVFHAMRQGLSSYPDLAAYHCIAVTLGQAGYVKELFDVIDCMRSPPETKFKTGMIEKWDPRLEPDLIIYNAVLNACARRKQWEGAFWVLQQLKQQGLQPSSTTYGLTMEVMFACEKYNLVYEFFRKVEKSTIPNSLNYKVLLNALWKEGKTDDAVFAVKDMERRGIVGSAGLYYDLARCLCSAGRCEEALMQMDQICKVANKPLVVTYTGLIQACLEAGNIQNGAYIFKQMQNFCSPNLVTCNIMLKAYLEHRMFEDAKDLFQKMLDDSSHITRRRDYKSIVNPDSYTFNSMLDGCAAEQKWDDFRYFFQQMLHRGYNFNTKRHLRLILESSRAGKGELLEMTWKHLTQANRVPPPSLVKERFCMKLEKNDYTAAISSIASHPTNNLQLIAFSEKGWLDVLMANTDRFQKDTIIKLADYLNNLVAGSDQAHPVIQNLIHSCREYIRTRNISAETNPTEVIEHSYI